MSELDLANHDGSSGGEDGASPRPATRGGWEGGHALKQQGAHTTGLLLPSPRLRWLLLLLLLPGLASLAALVHAAAAAVLHPSADSYRPPVACPAAPATAAVPGEEAGKPRVDETADKLDSMMELTFQHLERRMAAGQGNSAWDTLLGAFERCVLLTHRSKFTQVRMDSLKVVGS